MNEEPIAICEGKPTLKEYMRMFTYRMYRNPYICVLNSILLLSFLLSLLSLLIAKDDLLTKDTTVSILVAQTIYLFLFNGIIHLAGLSKYRQNYHILPENSKVQIAFFEDRAVKQLNDTAMMVLYYQNIKEVRYDKRMHYLVAPNCMWWIVLDHKFMKGNWKAVENKIYSKNNLVCFGKK